MASRRGSRRGRVASAAHPRDRGGRVLVLCGGAAERGQARWRRRARAAAGGGGRRCTGRRRAGPRCGVRPGTRRVRARLGQHVRPHRRRQRRVDRVVDAGTRDARPGLGAASGGERPALAFVATPVRGGGRPARPGGSRRCRVQMMRTGVPRGSTQPLVAGVLTSLWPVGAVDGRPARSARCRRRLSSGARAARPRGGTSMRPPPTLVRRHQPNHQDEAVISPAIGTVAYVP
jgi:hypothetical protein